MALSIWYFMVIGLTSLFKLIVACLSLARGITHRKIINQRIICVNFLTQWANALPASVVIFVLPEHSILNPSSDPPPHWWWRSLIASVYFNEYLLHLWIFKVCVDQTRSSLSSWQGQHSGLDMLNTCFVERIWVSQDTLSKIYFILGIT